MFKINWKKAPELATHAVSTGPKWNGGDEFKGTTRFAQLADDKYYDVTTGEPEGYFNISKRGWEVIEERPNA
jgi:hypothetical protein